MWALLIPAGFAGCLAACAQIREQGVQALAGERGKPAPAPTLADATPRDFPGIRNAVAYHDGYISGSVPEGDEAFDTLAAWGVRTIISVDGAVPDVASAQQRGMRYIHLPIGYNGFDEARRLELVRATRDALAKGPVYIHCHHGKHRSAGAAAAVVASLGWMTPEQGVERMKVSGTAPSYPGLYACALASTVLTQREVDAVPDGFVSVAPTPAFVRAMVELDEIDTHLALIEKAGWITPKDHPDLVPAAEAGRMANLLRVLATGDVAIKHDARFARMMRHNGDEAQKLETMMVAHASGETLTRQFRAVAASCRACHVAYRD
jgi:protein tyrosine phosphatase (PTP) superfamily phosphohydrolase (DUF442 family)